MARMYKFGEGNSDGWRFGHSLIDGGVPPPTRPVWKTLWPKNFLSQPGCLTLLRKSSPERLYYLNLCYCLAVPDYDSNLQNKFWLLMAFAVLCKYVSLKV